MSTTNSGRKAEQLRSGDNLTSRVIFGEVGHSGAASAVARRIRASVGAGLLADGERLPKESDLARQLGVTPFSLREALGLLREEGLVVTRPGRNGGSFVQVPADLTTLARNALGQLSAAELGDLGDWRRMLSGQTALLAAQRSSVSSTDRMRLHAEQVGTARSLRDARRAYGRFHLELAAAAQSARLTRAELVMQEEFALLTTLALANPDTRRSCSQNLLAITAQIRSREAEDARLTAEAGQTELLNHLVTLRLELLAREDARSAGRRQRREPRLADAVNQFVTRLLGQLEIMAGLVAPELALNSPGSTLSAIVARAVVSDLGVIDDAVQGLGVIAEVDTVAGERYWLDWWHREISGNFEHDSSHVLDPTREDFYDYEDREFMAVPRETGKAWAMGPYVDFGGTDEYIITVAVPILSAGEFLGIAGADILVAELERKFAPQIAANDAPTLLLNEESRVIISSSATGFVGAVLADSVFARIDRLEHFDWRVATERRATAHT